MSGHQKLWQRRLQAGVIPRSHQGCQVSHTSVWQWAVKNSTYFSASKLTKMDQIYVTDPFIQPGMPVKASTDVLLLGVDGVNASDVVKKSTSDTEIIKKACLLLPLSVPPLPPIPSIILISDMASSTLVLSLLKTSNFFLNITLSFGTLSLNTMLMYYVSTS